MKKLKKISDHILRFYRKAKKKIVRKIMIVATCLVCAFAPIYSNYKEVEAEILTTALVAGTLTILGLCGVTVAKDLDGADLIDACSNVVDGFNRFGETLAGTVKDKFNALIEGAMYTGKVALDAFNSLGTEIGHAVYDIFHTSNGNSYVGDVEIVDGVTDFITMGDTMLFRSPGNPLNNPNLDYLFLGASGIVITTIRNVYVLSTKDTISDNSLYLTRLIFGETYIQAKRGKYTTGNLSPIGDLRFYSYNSDGTSSSNLNRINLEDILFMSVFGNYFTINYGNTEALYLGNKWVDPFNLGLELDPPWVTNKGTNTDLTLLDDSYINYGDIDDIAIPRYVAPDATYTPEGVIDYPGSWSIPNQYIPNLDRPVPVPLPFPLPDIGTIPNDYTGDITKDTPIENTDEDVDIDDPDYVIPTVGDFLGDYDVPGKLNWKEYFPFCIPFDLIKFIGCLAAEPEAPNFKWDYEILGTKGTVKVDLKEYESVALVARTLFDLLFVLGLTMVTRNLIKG